jgi:hypothetical protein
MRGLPVGSSAGLAPEPERDSRTDAGANRIPFTPVTRYRLAEVWNGAPYGGNPEVNNNRVNRRRYFRIDGPLAHYGPGHNPVPFASDSYASAFAPIGTLTSGWAPANDLDINDEITTDSQLFVMQNYLFQRRLVTTLGLRRDAIDTFGPRSVRDGTTQMWRFATASDQALFEPSGRRWFEDHSETGYRRSLGAVFHVTQNFSLTANGSDGIELPARNRSVLPYERVPNPFKGEGRDYGINFSFLENKISGAMRYFESSTLRENTNEVVQTVFGNPNNDVMASFETYFRRLGSRTSVAARRSAQSTNCAPCISPMPIPISPIASAPATNSSSWPTRIATGRFGWATRTRIARAPMC